MNPYKKLCGKKEEEEDKMAKEAIGVRFKNLDFLSLTLGGDKKWEIERTP